MNKQRPSTPAIVGVSAFVAVCVGLLIYLWISFGGSIPLAPQGYRFSVEFDQAVELAANANVQISGVTVGHVQSVGLDHRTGLSRAVLEIQRAFAPRPADTRATLREKTLLGETYVELSPGDPRGPKVPDGGSLPQGQVAPTVQLDQIFSSFDPTTRRAFQTWMQQGAIAFTNRGEQFNRAFAELYPFATNVDAVLAVLHRQGAATRTLLHDGGVVFSALSHSPAALQGFVRNSNALFAATAARNQELAATIRAFPAFLSTSRSAIDRLTRFAQTAKPLIDELRPAAVALNPVLKSSVTLAPELHSLFVDIGPLTDASKAGLPALERFLDDTVPWLTRLKPYLGGLVPVIQYIESYRREVTAFFANSTATTQGTLAASGNKFAHYIRISTPIHPDAVAAYQKRLSTNRTNPYLVPGGYSQLLTGLPAFAGYLCTSNPLLGFDASMSASTTTVEDAVLTLAQLVQKYYYTSTPAGPPCRVQSPLGAVTTGHGGNFPHLQALP